MSKSAFKTISLERTMCDGECPVYVLKIKANGQVTLKQDRNYEKWTREVSWQIDRGKINKINEILHKYGYFTLKEGKPTFMATDHAFCITKIELQNGTKRKIEHYLGEDAYPKRLITIENWIDKSAGVNDFLKDPYTEY